MNIRTPSDWWALLDTHWPNLLGIARAVGAPLSGFAPELQGDNISTEVLLIFIERAKVNRDHEKMSYFLQLCWGAAPDEPGIHSWPSWGVLCDLCSEAWVFDPDEPEGCTGPEPGYTE